MRSPVAGARAVVTAASLSIASGCGPLLTPPEVSADGTSGDVDASTGGVMPGSTDTASATSAGEATGATSIDMPESGVSSEGSSDPNGTDTTAHAETSGDETSTGEPTAPDPIAHYEVTIINTWTEVNHPGALPPLAHFSWLGGATHDDGVSFWDVGGLSSPGITYMAEIGNTDILSTEVQAAIEAGHADGVLQWQQWFCPPSTDVSVCGESTVAFDVTLEYPLVTLVSMLGPSPDLFVGVSGLPLFADGAWVDAIVIDLLPYDGGTRSDLDFTMNGALQDPPRPISPIESFEDHMIGPGSLGTMTIVRVAAPKP